MIGKCDRQDNVSSLGVLVSTVRCKKLWNQSRTWHLPFEYVTPAPKVGTTTAITTTPTTARISKMPRKSQEKGSDKAKNNGPRIRLRLGKQAETTTTSTKAANVPKPTRKRQKISGEKAPKPATPIPSFRVNQGVYLNKVHEIWTDTSISTSFDYFEFLKTAIDGVREYAQPGSLHMESVEAVVHADGKRVKDEAMKVKLDMFRQGRLKKSWEELIKITIDLIDSKRIGVFVEIKVYFTGERVREEEECESTESEDEEEGEELDIPQVSSEARVISAASGKGKKRKVRLLKILSLIEKYNTILIYNIRLRQTKCSRMQL